MWPGRDSKTVSLCARDTSICTCYMYMYSSPDAFLPEMLFFTWVNSNVGDPPVNLLSFLARSVLLWCTHAHICPHIDTGCLTTAGRNFSRAPLFPFFHYERRLMVAASVHQSAVIVYRKESLTFCPTEAQWESKVGRAKAALVKWERGRMLFIYSRQVKRTVAIGECNRKCLHGRQDKRGMQKVGCER